VQLCSGRCLAGVPAAGSRGIADLAAFSVGTDTSRDACNRRDHMSLIERLVAPTSQRVSR
jgi:hypothetical protein